MKTINEEVNRRINDRLARLAEHAPDLLAMLERCCEEMYYSIDANMRHGTTTSEARALIAKIKGE